MYVSKLVAAEFKGMLCNLSEKRGARMKLIKSGVFNFLLGHGLVYFNHGMAQRLPDNELWIRIVRRNERNKGKRTFKFGRQLYNVSTYVYQFKITHMYLHGICLLFLVYIPDVASPLHAKKVSYCMHTWNLQCDIQIDEKGTIYNPIFFYARIKIKERNSW